MIISDDKGTLLDALRQRINELIKHLRPENEAFIDRAEVEAQLAELIDTELPPTQLGPTWERDEDDKFIRPEFSLGYEVIAWCQMWLRAFDAEGEDDQRPLSFTKEQSRFILWWYAIDEAGRFIFTMGTLQRLKGWGKDPLLAAIALVEMCGPCRFDRWENGIPRAKPVHTSLVQVAAVSQDQPLALDTPVPTPSGYTTVGDLRVGDVVFDEHGAPQTVRRQTDVLQGLDCYRVSFDDGTSVVASASHGWTVDRKNAHGDKFVTETVSTLDLFTANKRRLGRIACAPRYTPARDLPVDPYILGFWLGDGGRNNTQFAIRWSERFELETIFTPLLSEGWELKFYFDQNDTGRMAIVKTERYSSTPSLRAGFASAGVLNNKHIPQDYLLGSVDQRRALLQGLIDSDGMVDTQGAARFTNMNPLLIQGFLELAQSLGYKARVARGGIEVRFPTWGDEPVARIQRKRDRQVNGEMARFRYIRKVERAESVPVKCIGIDTESHLFQVGPGVATHNTRNTSDMFPVLMTPRFIQRYKIKHSIEYVRASGGRQQINMVTSSPKALEGKRTTFVVLNETQWWDASNSGLQMYGVIEGNVTKMGGGGARYLSICNAFIPGKDSVGELMRRFFDRIQEGKAVDIGYLYDTIESHPLVPMHPIALDVVIPKIRGDAYWLDTKRIMASIQNEVIPTSESRRKWLNQVVAEEDQLWDYTQWYGLECNDYLLPGDEIVLGFDGGRTEDSTALIAIRVKDCLVVPLGIWEKPDDLPGQDSKRMGDNAPSWTVDHVAVNSAVAGAMRDYGVVGMYSDVRYWESFVLNWGSMYGENMLVKSRNSATSNPVAWDMRLSIKLSTYAHQRLAASIEGGVMRWSRANDGEKKLSQVLAGHVLNVYRDENDHGVYFRKQTRSSTRKIDAYAALMLAHECRNDFLIRGKEVEDTTPAQMWIY